MTKPPLGPEPAFDVADALNAALEALLACKQVAGSIHAFHLCKEEAARQLRIAAASIEDGEPLPFVRPINGDGRYFRITAVDR